MRFDSRYTGPQVVTAADREYRGSTFSEVRHAVFANTYYLTWGSPGDPPLPVYEVALRRVVAGLLRHWRLLQAANRTVLSRSDLRWGQDRQGFRRLLHPNGVCLTGMWEIDARPTTSYTGYFKAGSKGLIVGRYSTCCTETRRGRSRSLSLVGKIYPTTDPDDTRPQRPANFITQEDFGGSKSRSIGDVELRNAPDTTPWRRGAGLLTFLLTGIALMRADKRPTVRQLYEIAELGKPADEKTRSPEFMRLIPDPVQPVAGDDLDVREEILGQIYDRGDNVPKRTLTFHIEVSDLGFTRRRLAQRVTITDWKRIGRIVFDQAAA